jgi:hypothetical protein
MCNFAQKLIKLSSFRVFLSVLPSLTDISNWEEEWLRLPYRA